MKPSITQLVESGYRVVSRRFKLVARVDVPAWTEYCRVKGYPEDPDWYRRCISKDVLTVSSFAIKLIPNSHDDMIGYWMCGALGCLSAMVYIFLLFVWMINHLAVTP